MTSAPTKVASPVRLQRNLFGADDVIGADDSDSWGTPLEVIRPVVDFFGNIDLDPCSNGHSIVPAKRTHTIVDDGLTQEWQGNVYCNPPYSAPDEWVKRCMLWAHAGQIDAVALLRPDWTTQWWHRWVRPATARCMWQDRLKFRRADGSGTTATFCSVLVYYGAHYARFDRIFSPYGEIQ